MGALSKETRKNCANESQKRQQNVILGERGYCMRMLLYIVIWEFKDFVSFACV